MDAAAQRDIGDRDDEDPGGEEVEQPDAQVVSGVAEREKWAERECAFDRNAGRRVFHESAAAEAEGVQPVFRQIIPEAQDGAGRLEIVVHQESDRDHAARACRERRGDRRTRRRTLAQQYPEPQRRGQRDPGQRPYRDRESQDQTGERPRRESPPARRASAADHERTGNERERGLEHVRHERCRPVERQAAERDEGRGEQSDSRSRDDAAERIGRQDEQRVHAEYDDPGRR